MLALEMCAPLVPVPLTFSGPAHEERGGDLGEVPVLSPSFVNYDATQVPCVGQTSRERGEGDCSSSRAQCLGVRS